MNNFVEDFQKIGQDNMKTAMANADLVSKTMQTIATETVDFSKKSFEEGTAVAEKLMGVKTLDKAVEIQTDYAKSSYEGLVAQATKVGEIYTGLAKEIYKPVEEAFAKATK